uniref:NAD-dependent epimerase/dehydratase domain-containing protein n=1 Tax=Oryza meridionalis TaxID=40149 RepID=A0A0E0ETK7_9ORYZ
MTPPPPRRRVVCVTGAGGFVGSWLVELLLSRGYAVHATVRDPDDPKNAFLKQLENAPDNLQLFKADVLDCGSLTAAFAGCEGVFHLATPVPEEKIKEMMAPTVEGTRNVLEACSAASVQKLVVVSSIATVCLNPSWPQDMPKDESSWSDKKLCIENEDWYSVAKIEAEEMALEYGKKNGLHTVEINTSNKALLYMIKGGDGPYVMNNNLWPMVDVRDVADALLLAYHKAGPSERYLCTLEQMDLKHLLDLMKNMYPNYNYADKMVDVDYKVEVTSEKLKNLGWNPRKREETLADSIKFFEKAGLLDGRPCRLPYFAGARFQSDHSGKVQPEMPPPPRVCVTGAGGFIGSWLVKLLLSRGYFVHGTVRNPDDPKNAFLKQLENATENLQLFKADVLDGGSLTAAFAGCEGVFHPATPVPEQQMKLVVVSSISAVFANPSWTHDRPKDETSWSDKKLCMETENWYSLAKTEGEEMALEYGNKNGLHVVTTLQLNTTTKALLYIIQGGHGPDIMNNKFWSMVDVRDVADALLLAYEEAGPSERYICALEQMDLKDLLSLMKTMYPNYNYVDKMVDLDYKAEVTSEKLKNLGWNPRKREETFADSIEFFEKAGLLDGQPCRLPYLYLYRFTRNMAAMASPPLRRVCVTGAGGFTGSWLVKLLLSRGYAVHATLRDPCDPKNAHLKQLDGASEMLSLFKADVLDSGELAAAIAGCEGVFHVASPVPGDKIVDPEVQKVVVVSSTAAVHYNPNWPPGKPKDESCWSDRKICMEKEEWYSASKVIAEKTALEYSEKKGGPNVMRNMLLHIVDVRDVAEALLLVYEKPESSGRYLCAPYHISPKATVEFLKNIYPNYNYSLGWKPRKLEETLTDSIEYYEKTGILQDAAGRPCMTPPPPPPPPPRRLVCVTGAGGFIGSWLVKLLLSRGYAVHATVRDPHDPKNAFLKQLEDAPENLRLFKADVLDAGSLTAAFAGCEGVFHPATPVPEHKTKEMLDPAVKGTRNVLEACSAASVQKLVVVSSIGAVCFNPSLPRDRLIDETCWSDKKSCKENENWYCLAKTEAEEMALEYSEKNGLHVITVCPALVLGPLLQTVLLSTSSKVLLYVMKGGPDAIGNTFFPIVDVRDVADALLLVYDKAGPSERYICSQEQMDTKDFLDLMKSMYPNYSYTFKVVDVDMRIGLTSEKLKKLGWKPRKLEETLVDSVESYKKAGFVDDEPCRLPHLCRAPDAQEAGRRRETRRPPEMTPRRVCVAGAGAGGFVGSWLVKLLLSRGYAVHATEMIVPAVKGTKNVLEACSASGVQKLVMISSIGAVCFNPSWPQDRVRDETCWSDKEFCRENKNWYCLAKTEAEEIALEYSEKNGLHVITVCPALVFGPLLHTMQLNTSSRVLLYIMKGGPDVMNNKFWPIVDVRDCMTQSGPCERYICAQDQMNMKDLVDLMKSTYPNYSYSFKLVDVGNKVELTSEKPKKLGWKPRKLEETLADSVESFKKAGLVDDEPCRLPHVYRMPDTQE